VNRFIVFLLLSAVGSLLLFVSGREMKAERLHAPIISSRTKHLIGLLLIFAGLGVFASQFLIYSR
jgi:hypothetical protein